MMSQYLFLVVLYTVYVSVESGTGNPWTYQGKLGPSHWHVDYKHCGGKKQSPINIETSTVRLNEDLPQFNLAAYSNVAGVEQELENVGGHTVEIKYHEGSLVINGGGLPGDYKVDQFHFHWGQVDARGSEHKVNGEQFPMEMHIVHHSTKYDNLTEAVDKPEGLAVLAFFFEVGASNPHFDAFLNDFDEIVHAGDEIELESPINLMSLLPEDMSVFWRYQGSLTTPPCFQTVIWTLFHTPIVVSEEQMNKYRSLKRNKNGEPEKPLVDDFRPLQSLHHRVVETNNVLGLSTAANEKSSHYTCLLVISFTFLIMWRS